MANDIAGLVERLEAIASLGEDEAYQQEWLLAYEFARDTLPVLAALQADVERLTESRARISVMHIEETNRRLAAERRVEELREALAVFVQNVDATSLSATLGHITREHLWRARATYKEEGNG